MEMETCVPPGFRFHPTEEELVGYYLTRKVNSMKIDIDVIVDIDLYRMEPWDIEDRCKLGYEEQTEWYFFSHKDRKYPTGTRTNRATAAGFWKATGRDKAVLSKSRMIGMRKTLVFYKGRAPNGRKSDWIMHEYRLQSSENAPPQEEGWVVCRAFKKPSLTNQRQGFESWNHVSYARENGNFKPPSYPDMVSSMQAVHPSQDTSFHQLAPLASYQDLVSTHTACLDNQFVELPQLDSPSKDVIEHSLGIATQDYEDGRCNNHGKQFVDWKNLESLLAPQVTEQASFTSSNFPLIAHEYDLNIHNKVSHLYGSFSDL